MTPLQLQNRLDRTLADPLHNQLSAGLNVALYLVGEDPGDLTVPLNESLRVAEISPLDSVTET